MTAGGRVSAVMVTYHTGPALFQAIEAVLAQEALGELILVDNGNPGPVAAALQRLEAEREPVKLLSGHGNVGYAAGCNLGAGSLVNTRASLDHESSLAGGASLAPGVITGGRVSVGRRAFVGIGSTVAQGVLIGEDSVVGAGSLVLKDVPNNVVVYGRPAKFVRKRQMYDSYL